MATVSIRSGCVRDACHIHGLNLCCRRGSGAHRSDSVSAECADEHPGVDYKLPFGYLLQDLAVWFDGGNIEGWLLNGAFLLLSGVSQTSTGVLSPHCYEPVLKSFL